MSIHPLVHPYILLYCPSTHWFVHTLYYTVCPPTGSSTHPIILSFHPLVHPQIIFCLSTHLLCVSVFHICSFSLDCILSAIILVPLITLPSKHPIILFFNHWFIHTSHYTVLPSIASSTHRIILSFHLLVHPHILLYCPSTHWCILTSYYSVLPYIGLSTHPIILSFHPMVHPHSISYCPSIHWFIHRSNYNSKML